MRDMLHNAKIEFKPLYKTVDLNFSVSPYLKHT